MRFVLRILFVLLAMGLLSRSVEAQNPPPSKQQVNALIQKLDSDSFAEREQAIAELRGLGKPIVPYLIEAGRTVESEEVRVRLDRLLQLHPLGPTAVLRGHTDWIMGVDFAPDGSKLVSVSRDRTVRMWDLTVRKSLYQSPPVQTPLETAIFTPDGKQMVVCGGNLRGGAQRVETVQRRQRRGDPFVSRSQGSGQSVEVEPRWEVSTGTCLLTLKHKDRARTVTFSPNGKNLAAACGDHTICIWGISTFLEVKADAIARTCPFCTVESRHCRTH